MLCSDLQHTEKMKMTVAVELRQMCLFILPTRFFSVPLYHHHLSPLLGGMAPSHIYDALCTKWVQLRATVQITSSFSDSFCFFSLNKISIQYFKKLFIKQLFIRICI